jgi:hypothetical protein
MFKTLEKILIAVLDVIAPQPPKPAPPPLPTPEPIQPIDHKTAAKEMREAARQLNILADRLDPFALPFPTVPNMPPKWNTFVDDDGTTGGLIKRKGSGVEGLPVAKDETIVDTEIDETDEFLNYIRRGCKGPCAGRHK